MVKNKKIKSFKRDFPKHMINNKFEVVRISDGFILTPWLAKNGYYEIGMTDANGNNSRMYLHRVIAEMFIPNDKPKTKVYINHIDGVKTNNSIENLEWVTHKENMHHAIAEGLMPLKVSKYPEKFYKNVLDRLLNREVTLTEVASTLSDQNTGTLAKHVKRLAKKLGKYEEYRQACTDGKARKRKEAYVQAYTLQKIDTTTLEVIQEYTSTRHACEANDWDYSKSRGSIHNACHTKMKNGSRRRSRGYYWNEINLN